MKKGIIVINLGTPTQCSKKYISKYLREFLIDKRVINIPFIKRWLLVNLIIVPFRTPKILKEYQKIWTPNGFPLLVNGKNLVEKLKRKFNYNCAIELAMRYQQPSIKNALNNLKSQNVEQIIVLPLYPQYASATTGSTHQEVMKIISTWNTIPQLKFISSYYNNNSLIECFANKILSSAKTLDNKHLVLSYHGIPQKQIDKTEAEFNTNFNYQKACFETSRLIAEKLNISTSNYTTCFQSRIGKEDWIKPYTIDTISELAQNGISNVIVCSPSFLADCLETSIEIGVQYKELFLEKGGKSFIIVDSLNSDDSLINTLHGIINDF